MNLAITLTMIVVYIAGLIYLVYRNPLPQQDFEEFAVGGRSFGWAFITMTIIGTWYAGSMYVGWAQMGVEQGIVVTYVMFYTLGGLYILYVIAGPLWKLGKKYGIKTMGHYFELRYKSRSLRTFTGFVALLIEFPWVVTELLAAGYAMQAISYGKIPFNLGMTIIAVIFIAYIVFAGMRAVIIADFYQGWMYIIGGVVMFLAAGYAIFGGYRGMFMEVRNLNAEFLTVPGPLAGWGGDVPGALFWPSLILMGAIGAYMWPSLIARIFAASSTKELKASSRFTPLVAVAFTLVITFFFVGAAARPEFKGEDSAYAVVNLLSTLGPVAVAVICILILNGSLSMMDSMVSTWSIVLVNDCIAPYTKVTSKGLTNISRISALVIGFGGLLISMQELPSIIQLVIRMYQGIVQFFPAVILGIFWKRGNKWSAWSATVVGLAITGIFSFTQPDFVPALNGLQGGLVALAANFLVYVVVALVTKPAPGVEQLFIDAKTADADLGRELVR
jgi:SSS family solute:Na+ symporter